MAFTTSSPTLGEWVPIGWDPKRKKQAKFRLRRLDNDTIETLTKRMERKYGTLQKNRNTGVKELVVDPKKKREHDRELGLLMFCAAVTGAKDCWVELTDQEDVDLYSEILDRDDLKRGDEVCIDGPEDQDHPHIDIKKNVIGSDFVISQRIRDHTGLGGFDEIAVDDETYYPEDEEEEDLKKTSSERSNSVRAIRSESA